MGALFDDMKDKDPNLNQKEFAAKCNIKESQMHNYLNGVNNPPLYTLILIAQKCGTNVSWLIGEHNIIFTPNIEIEMLCKNLDRHQVAVIKQFIRFL